MSGSELTIALLLPDVLGTYSDAGNALVLAARARSRGVAVRTVPVLAGDVPPTTCELYLLGGGEDAAQAYALEWFGQHQELRHVMAERALTFAVCAGLQVLGTSLTDGRGHRCDGLGLLDLSTAPGPRRAVGEIVTRCSLPGVGLLTGFENHRGVTTLGATPPLGRVLSGTGNGAGHRGRADEGALTDHVVATYLHGPVLARNPALADHLLERVTGRPFTAVDGPDVPDLARMRHHYLSSATGRGGARRRTRG